MTVEQVSQIKTAYEQASNALHNKLASDGMSGPQKHATLCRHRLEYGRHPFVCPNCWSYLPICVCSSAGAKRFAAHDNLSIVVWTHHREWGLTSNTGGILSLLLKNCHVLMKGLPEHDSQFADLIMNPDNLVVILWPNESKGVQTPEQTSPYLTLDQVKNELQTKRVILVAVDGTWRNARRMVARLPRNNIFYANISIDTVRRLLVDSVQDRPPESPCTTSLLAPLRGRGPGVSDNQVCTAEAVTAALLQLGLKESDGLHIVSVAKQKVDLICRYRAKVSTLN